MRWPPLSIIAVCVLTIGATVAQALRGGFSIPTGGLELSPAEQAVAWGFVGAVVAFNLFTLYGVWRMRRWAVVVRLLVQIIAPIQMTIAWHDSWMRYPILGPFVSWFWFAVIAACLLPHWNRMAWRFP